MLIGILIFVALVFTVLIVSASLLRCKKCGKWHDSIQDENECEGPQ